MPKMAAFLPPPQMDLGNGYILCAPEGMRHPTDGITAAVHLFNGTIQLRRNVPFNDGAQLTAVAKAIAKRAQLLPDAVEHTLLSLSLLVEDLINQHEAKNAHLDVHDRYTVTDQGTFLKHVTGQGDYEEPLANFSAVIVTDITYDDGTPETKRSFALEARVHGETVKFVLTERDFARMQWHLKALGSQAMMEVGPLKADHLRLAIQSRSTPDKRTVFVHTGWRQVDDTWCYLHTGGAITSQGLRDDILVHLAGSLAPYHLPAPPTDADARRKAFRASLGLRHLAPDGAMITILGAVYVAPLRPFLPEHPPDFVGWITGASGRFKTEYAILGMQHFGADFTSRNVPASFIATGNSLERLSHAAKDALLLVDDYYPATDRRTRDAMALTAGRLLRSIGNQTGRPRMNADTTLRPDLPPRCVALVTGECEPEGLSTNARLLLQPVAAPDDPVQAKQALTKAQETKTCYSIAMACALQQIATQWSALEIDLPLRFRTLRTDAMALGTHSREPGHAAHLQLAWEVFTACALHEGAITSDEWEGILQETWQHVQTLASGQGAMLHSERVVQRFVGLLLSGFAAKRICLRTLDDQPPVQDGPETWGWTLRTVEGWQGRTDTIYDAGQAKMLGYLDTEHLYLLPEPLQEYLTQASRAADQAWPADAKTLYRELDEAQLLTTKPVQTWVERLWGKKICQRVVRVLHIKRARLLALNEHENHEDNDNYDGILV